MKKLVLHQLIYELELANFSLMILGLGDLISSTYLDKNGRNPVITGSYLGTEKLTWESIKTEQYDRKILRGKPKLFHIIIHNPCIKPFHRSFFRQIAIAACENFPTHSLYYEKPSEVSGS